MVVVVVVVVVTAVIVVVVPRGWNVVVAPFWRLFRAAKLLSQRRPLARGAS